MSDGKIITIYYKNKQCAFENFKNINYDVVLYMKNNHKTNIYK